MDDAQISQPAPQVVVDEMRGIVMDSRISPDGSTLCYYTLTPEKQGEAQISTIEQWDLSTGTARLIKRAPLETNNTSRQTISGTAPHDRLAASRIPLIPCKTSALHSNPVQFLGNGSFVRVGTHLREIDSGCMPEKCPAGLNFFTEYWEGADRRGQFVAVSRRKQPQDRLNPEEESARQRHLMERIEENYKVYFPQGRPSRTPVQYGDGIDIDDMATTSEHSSTRDQSSASQASETDDESIETTSIHTESFFSENNDEEGSEAQSQNADDNFQSFSDSESETSFTSQLTSSSFASSSTTKTTASLERLQTIDILDTSGNPAHYDQLMKQGRERFCDECGKGNVRHQYHCFVCQDNDFDLCLDCIAKGYWCFDTSHQMMESDEEGPITFREYSDWRLLHELRVYDTRDGEECVLEFSMKGEGFLHESGPVLHPTMSLVAWPMSPTKLLLASFDDTSDRVIQRLKPSSKGGHIISCDLRFSPCGSYLFVANVEATPSSMKQTAENKTFDLSVQLTLLQLSFKDGTLSHPVPIWQKNVNTFAPVSSALLTLPYTWNWTPSEVFFTLTGAKVTIFKLPIVEAAGYQPPTLGTVKKLTVDALGGVELNQMKAQVVPAKQHQEPLLVLFPVTRNSAVEPQCHTLPSQWEIIDNHKESSAAAAKRSQIYITPSHIAYDASPSVLNKVRSEIRLLSLLPGKKGDPIRCKLSKVSLDDLERTRGRLNAYISELYERSEERDRPAQRKSDEEVEEVKDPNFTPKELTRMDSSDFQGSEFSLSDLMAQAVRKVTEETGTASIYNIGFKNLDPKTTALVDMFFRQDEEKSQKRFKVSLPPQYNYEALSYVWGKSTQNRSIILDDDKKFPVTNNLYAALGRLRRPDKARTLWVDSLCIDQKNTTERNHQVHMMGRIYNSAASVIAWLGDADDIPKPVVSNPVTPIPQTASAPTTNTDDNDTTGVDPAKALGEWHTQVLRSTLRKASPPWWTRAWITQEIVLASEVSVAFGAVELSWSQFYSDMLTTWRDIPELSRLFSLRLNRRHWQYKGSLGETAQLARHCAATDPRDKVYSLLSLVTPAQALRMTPDYALAPPDIFVQATYVDLWCNCNSEDVYAESVASERGDGRGFNSRAPRYPVYSSYGDDLTVNTGMRPDRFRVLNWAKPTPRRISGLPTWAVDFSDPTCFTEDAHFRYGNERWTFDGNRDLYKRAGVDLLPDGRTLAVRGMVLDVVDKVVTHVPIREYRSCAPGTTPDLQNVFRRLPRKNPYVTATGVAGEARLRTQNLRKVMRPKWIIKQTKPDTIEISYEDVVEQVLESWDPNEAVEVDWADVEAVDYTQCEIEGCRCGPSRLFKAWDNCVGLPDRARNLMNHDSTKATSPWDRYCERMQKRDGSKGEDPLREEDVGFLLTTRRGFVGVARDSVRSGDVIALFYGSDVPVVLRPQSGPFTRYTYEGRAWINGIMQGELWNIFEDPMLETRTFEIR